MMSSVPSVESDNKKRGVSHSYKNTKTTSSQRVQACKHVMTSAEPTQTKERKRSDKKEKLLETLPTVTACLTHAVSKESLKEKSPFISGTSKRQIPCSPQGAKILSALLDFKVVESADGAQFTSPGGDIVFRLLPRKEALKVYKKNKNSQVIESLLALEQATKTCLVRGKTRQPIADDKVSRYLTIGLSPHRAKTGLFERKPREVGDRNWHTVQALWNQVEHAILPWVESRWLWGLAQINSLGSWNQATFAANRSQPRIWGSLAMAKNHYLNSHVDVDFFLSVINIQATSLLGNDYSLDEPITQYFVFPEFGLSVALRPGDILLFNPLYYHSISSRAEASLKNDSYCLSYYLKTAVVGGNDNSLKLTDVETKAFNSHSL
jgi:hypothetical protein